MKNNKGFTLIELLVVVLIIGILAGVAIPQYMKSVSKSRVSEALVVTKNVADAQNRFRILSDDDSFADNFAALDLSFINERGEENGESLAGTRAMEDTYYTKNYTYIMGVDRVIACPLRDTACEIQYLFARDINTISGPVICIDGANAAGLCTSLGLRRTGASACGALGVDEEEEENNG